MQGVEIAFDVVIVILLCVLIVRQEMIHMADETQEQVLEDKITAIDGDEATIAASIKTIVGELNAVPGIPQSVFDRLDALHTKFQGDAAAAAAAGTPATPAV